MDVHKITEADFAKVKLDNVDVILKRMGSAGRPWGFLGWCADSFQWPNWPSAEVTMTILGRGFWQKLRKHWPGFDAVPHWQFSRYMVDLKPYWQPDDDWRALPETFTAYRGQDRAQFTPGLSWTLDRAVAKGFARGHRGMRNPDPVVLRKKLRREDVAMVIHDRSESEVVLFDIPRSRQ